MADLGTTGYISNGTIANGYTFTLGTGQGKKPDPEPKGLIATQAVPTKAGWLGQVYVDKMIVHETRPQEDSETAIKLANERVVEVFQGLFLGGNSS